MKLALILFLLTILPMQSYSQERLAFLIGNDRYSHIPALKNAANDATLVGQLLANTYSVTSSKNADLSTMEAAIAEMGNAANSAGTCLFYFAGHGVEIDGENFLIPIDCRASTATELKESAISLNRIFESLSSSKATKVIILDCCRDNPFQEGELAQRLGTGLAPVDLADIPGATLVVFSGEPGKAVPDGTGNNSPFTENFVAKGKK